MCALAMAWRGFCVCHTKCVCAPTYGHGHGYHFQQVCVCVCVCVCTQYFDMLREMGSTSRASTIFLSHTPGALQDVAGQIRCVCVCVYSHAYTTQVDDSAGSQFA